MKVIGAWCGKELDERPSKHDSPVSHGICESCAFHLQAARGISFQRFLDALGVSIIIVVEDAVVLGANKQAQEMLEKVPSEIEGFKGGEVFECGYALLPDGCGRTKHCSGCTIRNTVMDTMSSGESHIRTPVTLNHREAGELPFHITTEKVRKVVMLNIDDPPNQG